MNSLYKRFVTMSMISFSAILGWVYCVLEFRDKAVYIAAISLVLVISLYALLFAAYGIKAAKDKQMEDFITQTVTNLLTELNKKDNEELERITKASYIQLRKSTTLLSQIAETEQNSQAQNLEIFNQLSESTQALVNNSVNKALKLAIKYNQVNNDKLVESIKEMSEEVASAYKELSTSLTKLNLELIDLKGDVSRIQVSDSQPQHTASLDMFDSPEEDVTTPSVDSFFDEFSVDEPISEEATSTEEAVSEDTSHITADIPMDIPEDIPVATVKEDTLSFMDENGPLVPDDNAMLDQSLIDALLGNLSTPEVSPAPVAEEAAKEPTADIIPFPSAEPAKEEAPAIDPDYDPNKPMSPEEIAALFASMNGGDTTPEPEPEPEPAPTPVNDDPNRQLSPDEIAALFASMQ